ncbi:MAG: hypothetical protein KJO54_12420 [Gammaproteobacteria bacterium]|nr:hypothetical protein [Gammaproteobacteria bacterium]NNF61563.1 hypothetical protein [Gammaproteobacteria bacterium]
MIALTQLWLPILLSAVLMFVASSLIHMVLKYHNADYKELPNEDEVSSAIRNGSPATGIYTMPHCKDMSAMNDEAMQKKFADGPVAMLTVMPNGMPNMGVMLPLQFVYFVLASTAIAYCAKLALVPGAQYMEVFRFVGTVAFLTHGFAHLPYSIWYGHPWSNAGRFLLDALIYGSLTAGTFAWLWPAA